jgi:hypothetical protein
VSGQRWESVHLSEIDPAGEPDPGATRGRAFEVSPWERRSLGAGTA